MIILKILALFASIGLAILIIRNRYKIVQAVGKNEYAERFLGVGGTYTFWILFAILLIIISVVWLVGVPGR